MITPLCSPCPLVEFLATGDTKLSRRQRALLKKEEREIRAKLTGKKLSVSKFDKPQYQDVPPEKQNILFFIRMIVRWTGCYIVYGFTRAWYTRSPYQPLPIGTLSWKAAGDTLFFAVMAYCILEMAYMLLFLP
jgi:hypothetical protein